MRYQAIKSENWDAYFNLLSKMAQGRQMLLELIGKEIGDQIEEDWNLFGGLSYDRTSDTLFVQMQNVEHSILCPQEIVSQEDGALMSISIRDAKGLLQIIHFRDPLLLEGT